MSRAGPLLLLVAAVVIAGVVLFRERQLAGWQERPAPQAVVPRVLAPGFELPDQQKRIVKLSGMLGRERIVLLFLEYEQPVDADPRLARLADCFATIDRAGFKLLAVTAATRYEVLEAARRRSREFPFPVLTDIHPQLPVTIPAHRAWGRFDSRQERGLGGLFLIGRDGFVIADSTGRPQPVADEESTLAALCRGEWPLR